MTLNNWATLYVNLHQLSSAQNLWEKALQIYTLFAEKEARAYQPKVATVQANLQILHQKMNGQG